MAYQKIVSDCRKRKVLFTDSDFPANNSILCSTYQNSRCVKWLRPHEITSSATFTEDGYSRFDLQQGSIGDCWVVAALSCLSEKPVILERLIPKGQSLNAAQGYCGVFRFKFYSFGKWVEVVIDDRLPTEHGTLIYTHSSQENEFWGALLEKAYAKLAGSYENLVGGRIVDALQNFSGGLIESFLFKKPADLPSNFLNTLFKGFERDSCVAASIHSANNVKFVSEGVLSNGLVMGHAYTITDLRVFDRKSRRRTTEVTLIRLRNPWGGSTEWNGKWSDNSRQWNAINQANKSKVGLIKASDGEFWMDWNDFVTNYDQIDVCHLCPEDINSKLHKEWNSLEFYGEWVSGESAGGQPYYSDTHWKNPQFIIRLQDSGTDEDDLATCVMNLEEPDRRARRIKGKYVSKAVYVYKLDKQYADKLANLQTVPLLVSVGLQAIGSVLQLAFICLYPAHIYQAKQQSFFCVYLLKNYKLNTYYRRYN